MQEVRTYIGVWIDDGLTWRQDQVEAVRRKCFAGLAKLKKTYCALVQPHLDYCSVVWQECSLELKLRLDRIQNHGMRLIMSQPPRTPSEGLRKSLNWMPLSTKKRAVPHGIGTQVFKKAGPSMFE